MAKYKVGDEVECYMENYYPNPGWKPGKVHRVLPNYAGGDRTKYDIHGEDYITITSKDFLRNKGDL